MSIIGMGKLGSRELNFSSDVDILFVASKEVVTSAELARFGERVAKRTAELLDAPLDDGRVFRVDLRLRPDGSRGALLAYPQGLQDYYARMARAWERAALLRARVVAGEPEPGAEALALLEPIRYPRHVDPKAVDDLRAMKERIDREARTKGAHSLIASGWDVKLGEGGIREVEFVVSAFQCLLSGQRPELREVSTYAGLGRLVSGRFLEPDDGNDLEVAYRFYRAVEHRLQMDEDRQTHRLPTQALERERLARRLGFADFAALEARLGSHRRRVRQIFQRVLGGGPAPRRQRRPADEVLDRLSDHLTGEATETTPQSLEKAQIKRPKSALGALAMLYR
jgi:glutamate-ammonia-ligase adenylyltransferase